MTNDRSDIGHALSHSVLRPNRVPMVCVPRNQENGYRLTNVTI
jgi:hypothetical protein